MCQNVPELLHSDFIKLSLNITAQCSNSAFEVSQVEASTDSNWRLIHCISWHQAPHFWRFQSATSIRPWYLKIEIIAPLQLEDYKSTCQHNMPCPRGAGVRFLILLLSLSCFFATCIICVVVVQSWCLHGGGCCCFHFCSCCPFRCSLSELLAPFKLLSMMVVGGTSRGASGALDGELAMISRCPRPGASSYIVLLLVISSRHMFLKDLFKMEDKSHCSKFQRPRVESQARHKLNLKKHTNRLVSATSGVPHGHRSRLIRPPGTSWFFF